MSLLSTRRSLTSPKVKLYDISPRWWSRRNDEWWIPHPTAAALSVLRPLLFCPSTHGFALADLSPSFSFSLPFFIKLISFTWRLFTCLTHPGQSVLLRRIVSSLLSLLFALPAPVSSLFLICLVDLVAHFGLCALASTYSRFWPSAGLLNPEPKCVFFFSTSDNLMFYTQQSGHLFEQHLIWRGFPRRISLRILFFYAAFPNFKKLAVVNQNAPPAADQTHSSGKMRLYNLFGKLFF